MIKCFKSHRGDLRHKILEICLFQKKKYGNNETDVLTLLASLIFSCVPQRDTCKREKGRFSPAVRTRNQRVILSTFSWIGEKYGKNKKPPLRSLSSPETDDGPEIGRHAPSFRRKNEGKLTGGLVPFGGIQRRNVFFFFCRWQLVTVPRSGSPAATCCPHFA